MNATKLRTGGSAVGRPSYQRPLRCATKRAVDVAAAAIGLTLTGWAIGIAALVARYDTKSSGFFRQQRIGRGGRLFWVYKIRTMRTDLPDDTTATAADDPRITPVGRLLRRWKIDELPQLWNVLIGEMSLVGPRPEVPQHLAMYQSLAPTVLEVRPGVTGPATLKYRDEEQLLALAPDPDWLNETVLLPDKLRLNEKYAHSYTVASDFGFLLHTVLGSGPRLTRLEQLPTPSQGPTRHAA